MARVSAAPPLEIARRTARHRMMPTTTQTIVEIYERQPGEWQNGLGALPGRFKIASGVMTAHAFKGAPQARAAVTLQSRSRADRDQGLGEELHNEAALARSN